MSPRERRSAHLTVAGQGIDLADRSTISGSLAFGLGVASAAVARTVPSEPVAHHGCLDIGAIETADRDAPIISSLPGQLASNLFAEHERLDGFPRLNAAWLTPVRRSNPLKPNRHIAQFDRITVSNIGDLPDQGSFEALSSRGGPRERQKPGELGQDAAVHDLLTANAQVEGIDPSYTGTTAMAIVPLPLPPAAEARTLLHHILKHGDIVGRDTKGRTVLQLAVDDWTMEKLLTFDADADELEDGADHERDADDEEDSAPVVVELLRPKVVRRVQVRAFGQVD
jgi:hypothetical protein